MVGKASLLGRDASRALHCHVLEFFSSCFKGIDISNTG
jgi:hypothetical protein